MPGVPLRPVRPARPGEGALLTALSLRAKAHWGYGPAFMALCRPLLDVSEAAIAAGRVFVSADAGEVPVGVGMLDGPDAAGLADLDHLFVEPAAMGQGHGRALVCHLLAHAARAGARQVQVAADPNSTGFYRRLGAREIGEVPSDAIPGRRLPLLVWAAPFPGAQPPKVWR